MKNSGLRIFAGPDSLDDYNIDEVYQIAEMKGNGKQAVYGARTVGLKSRTNFDGDNSSAGFMGYDFNAIMKNFDILHSHNYRNFQTDSGFFLLAPKESLLS